MSQLKPLCADLQKVACEELGEVSERIPEHLECLRLWIQQQPHLNSRTNDQFLIQFLRGCKYSLEKAKEKIDHYNAMKTKYSAIFSVTNVDDRRFRELHNLGTFLPLPSPLNENGPRIVFFRFKYSVDKYTIEDICIPINAVEEIMLIDDPYACVQGVIYLVDLGPATASHFLQVTPALLLRLNTFYEKTIPLRIKAACFINASPVAEQFIKLLLACVSDKLRKRIYVCGKNIADLYGHVPQKYWPQDYGGSNGKLDELCAEYNQVLDEHREYFQQNAEYGTDERLRVGEPVDVDGIFGAGGTFRKINVD